MRRFAYAPDVNAYISTQEYGFIDVSADIISGDVTRRLNAVSNASLVIQNPNRKYLKKIKPMDRIVIYLTRIHKPILVFSGYVDRAPFDQLFPGPVKITASCTLKRLLHTYWDPGLPFVQRWLSEYGWYYDPQSGTMLDPTRNLYNSDISGGLGHMIRAVMKDVGGWPVGQKKGEKNTVHVMELPEAFINKTKNILKQQIAVTENQQEIIDMMIEQLLTIDGIGSGKQGSGGADDQQPVSNVRDSYPLPVDVAKKNYALGAYGEAVTVGNGPGGQYRALALAAAAEFGVRPDIYLGLIRAESNWNPDAGSSAGARGLTQFMQATAEGFGYDWDLFIDDPEMQLEAGARFMRNLYRQFGRWDLALAGYNGGPSRLESVGRDISQMPSETRAYVPKVLEFAEQEKVLLANGGAPKSGTRQGKIGDVRASNVNFFENFGGTMVGRTFRMKPNPFNDDSMIFRAVYNKETSGLQCYIPGWANKGTEWAKEWKSGSIVNLETSKGGEPFSGSGTTSTSKTATTKTGTFLYPIAVVSGHSFAPTSTQSFGDNRGDHIHAGIDIGAPEGTPLLACVSGTIIANAQQPGTGAGNYVILRETGTDRTYSYFHLQYKSAIKVGTAVKQGQQIGRVGTSGMVNKWPHLHFEYHPNGGKGPSYQFGSSTAADPGPLLRKAWNSDMKQTSSATSADDPDSDQTVYGATGVQVSQEDIIEAATSTVFGIELGFPAVANIIEAENLTGARALANDVPLFEWVDFMAKASGRSFQSMPNGDIFFFYPDYFNWSGKDPYFTISPIETINLDIDISDEELTTHVFTTGDVYMDGQIDIIDKMASTVASVEQTETFQTLVNVNNFDALEFLKRYGARPKEENRVDIKHSLLQFMYGWMTFLELWAKQFYCFPEFTFMPELFPGSTVEFKAPHDMQFYVQEVSHSFDRASGFSTSASFIAPSTRGGYNPAMVLSDGGLKQKTIKKK
jgi:murein DD-endopeptidase MepM/ murein hydrolase activator NlpD